MRRRLKPSTNLYRSRRALTDPSKHSEQITPFHSINSPCKLHYHLDNPFQLRQSSTQNILSFTLDKSSIHQIASPPTLPYPTVSPSRYTRIDLQYIQKTHPLKHTYAYIHTYIHTYMHPPQNTKKSPRSHIKTHITQGVRSYNACNTANHHKLQQHN